MAVQPQASPTPERSAGLRRSLAPLIAGYWAFGQFWGTFVVILTDFERAHDLSDGDLGLFLGALSIVSILTMTLGTPQLQSFPLFVNLPLSLLWMSAGALLLASPSVGLLLVAFLVLGVGNGLVDVFFNVAAQGLEARERRPALQFLHAGYSLGGISGGLGSGIAVTAGVPYRTILTAVALILVLVAAVVFRSRPLRAIPRSARAEHLVSVAAFRRHPALVLPAVVVLFAFLVEGSMDVWSGAYVRRTLKSSALVAGTAFAVFSFSMAVGRVSVARLLHRFGYRRTVLFSGLGSLAAGSVAAATSSPVVAAGAFLFLGFFIASAAPAAFGMVEGTADDAALAVSAMTTVGYTGFVVGPFVLGWLAESAGLRATMVVIAACTLGVALGGLFTPARQDP